MIKTRFAPSPTGLLHIGGLRTALFSYLIAKKNSGKFILRIEDTDQERFVEGGIENIIRSLKWAGIDVDEGVDIEGKGERGKGKEGVIVQKGENGPYIQSERLDIYQKHIQKLLDGGHAYYCFCSKERLEELRKAQEVNKQPTLYDGHCRNLTAEELQKKLAEKQTYVVRMKMPKEGTVKFVDLIRCEVEFKNELIDDQVLLKSDGFPTYHLAHIVDDHLMGITHVIRGEEWLPSVPKHLKLYEMFGWELPQFAHIPLLVNEQKQKLSKRHGDVSVEDFINKGYLPEAMVNFIAFLGWNPGGDREIFSLKELEKEFSLEKVGKSAAVFNREKLDWYNAQYIRKMSLKELTERCLSFFGERGKRKEEREWLENVVALEKERANTLVELVDEVRFVFAEKLEYEPELLVWKKSTAADAKEKLGETREILEKIDANEWGRETIEKIVMDWIKGKGYNNGDVLWPMRVALSGKKNSPGPFEIAEVLGKEKTIGLIQKAAEKL
ncbi:MAG: glutamate--tRNA ligase [Patescibacteria group bacterium]